MRANEPIGVPRNGSPLMAAFRAGIESWNCFLGSPAIEKRNARSELSVNSNSSRASPNRPALCPGAGRLKVNPPKLKDVDPLLVCVEPPEPPGTLTVQLKVMLLDCPPSL